MLIARLENDELVLADKYGRDKPPVFCPACEQAVVFKQGQQKIAHFAHRHHEACDVFSEGETLEHLQGKLLLFEWLGANTQLEAYLPELKQRPDILTGELAVELQCSQLSFERFVERTQNYQDHQYRPWWILGQNFTPGNLWTRFQKACCVFSNHSGLMLWQMDYQQKALILIYAIRWHYQKGMIFKKRAFPLMKWQPQVVLNWQPHPSPTFQWPAHAYRQALSQKLVQKPKHLMALQEVCYLQNANLTQLPDWLYQASEYHFFFEDELLLLRFFFQQNPQQTFKEWLQRLAGLNWHWRFPLVSQKAILWGVFCECRKLTENFEKRAFH